MVDEPLSRTEENDLRDLISQVRRGNLVLFVGSGVSAEAGLPSAGDIGRELAAESEYTGTDPADLPNVTEYFERRFDRDSLVAKLKSIFRGRSASTDVTSYDLVAELGVFPRIVTTNWDDLIEDAFTVRRKPLNVIKSDQSLPQVRQTPYSLMKLHGDFSTPPDEMVITTNDYIHTYSEASQVGSMFGMLGSWLQTQTVLFVGYSLRDVNFRYLFNFVRAHVSTAPVRHYAIMRQVDEYEGDAWARDNVRIIRMPAQAFYRRLFLELKEFVNRDLEIEYICNQGKQPFVEIYGPIGCGKSELLGHAARLYRLKVPDWSICEVFKPGLGMPDPVIEDQDEFAVIERLSLQIAGKEITRSSLKQKVHDSEEREAREQKRPLQIERAAAIQGANELAEALCTRQVGLFFDEMDRLPMKTVEWLERDFLPRLWERHSEPETKVRVVFAGRTRTRWRNWFVKKQLYPLQLHPLSEIPVSAMLRSTASLTRKAPLPRQTVDQMVARILWLTGGHPRAVRNILKHLATQNFDVYMGDPDRGSRDYFQQERLALFNGYVYPVIEPMLTELSDDTKKILHGLSAFPRFNSVILEKVCQSEYAETSKPPKQILAELRQIRLLENSHTSLPEALDPMTGYILAEWLEVNEPERYLRLNQMGAVQFDYWIEDMRNGVGDSENWRTYMVESIYHHALLVRLTVETAEQLIVVFQTHLLNLAMASEKAINALGKLKEDLENDKVLIGTVFVAVGQDGYDRLLRKVDERMDNLAAMP